VSEISHTCIVAGPIFSRSGYGDHARSIVKSLIRSAKYDVKIVPLPWGGTPDTALDRNNPDHVIYFDRLIPGKIEESNKPDIFIHITIPSEFQAAGQFNIGITAGIECTKMRPEWIEGCNRMNLVITTSRFSAEVFKINRFERRNNQSNQVEGILELSVPIEVLFEGFDPNVFDKRKPLLRSISNVMKDLPAFNFLFCGHWLNGALGHDRKDVGMLVKVFLDTFKRKADRNRPGLILKTGLAGFSITEREMIEDKINQIVDLIRSEGWKKDLPSIYILNGELSDAEMNSLYNHPKIKAMVSFTHGEGFGRPLLEFTTTGKPVIASGWSGQIDFLHPDHSWLLPGQLINVDRSAQNEWIVDGQWFQVNYNVAANAMLQCHAQYDQIFEKSRKHRKITFDHFTEDMMEARLVEIIDRHYSNSASPAPKFKKLSLPTLKKVT
jgi:hypothetical protein